LYPEKSQKTIQSKEHLVAQGNKFVENIKYYITRCRFENIYNSDQSEFQLELHANRLKLKAQKRWNVRYSQFQQLYIAISFNQQFQAMVDYYFFFL